MKKNLLKIITMLTAIIIALPTSAFAAETNYKIDDYRSSKVDLHLRNHKYKSFSMSQIILRDKLGQQYITYCIDFDTPTKATADYTSVPFEKGYSTQVQKNAGNIKAILMAVQGKTDSDTIAAAQAAIWHYTNHIVVGYDSTFGYSLYDSSLLYGDAPWYVLKGWTYKTQKLYEELIHLPAVAEETTLVPANIKFTTAHTMSEELISVTIRGEVADPSSDVLNYEIILSDEILNNNLSTKQTFASDKQSFDIDIEIPLEKVIFGEIDLDKIAVTVKGQQLTEGYTTFQAKGGYQSSQTLVGLAKDGKRGEYSQTINQLFGKSEIEIMGTVVPKAEGPEVEEPDFIAEAKNSQPVTVTPEIEMDAREIAAEAANSQPVTPPLEPPVTVTPPTVEPPVTVTPTTVEPPVVTLPPVTTAPPTTTTVTPLNPVRPDPKTETPKEPATEIIILEEPTPLAKEETMVSQELTKTETTPVEIVENPVPKISVSQVPKTGWTEENSHKISFVAEGIILAIFLFSIKGTKKLRKNNSSK